jgi:hypothetical protein
VLKSAEISLRITGGSHDLRDMATTAVSSAYSARSTWREDVGKSFTCRLNATGEISPPWATPAHMLQRLGMADWKDIWNVQQWKYEDMVFTR